MAETVTVVLPTFRRPDALANVLDGLRRQVDPGIAWDVVVVDNDVAPGGQGVFEAASSGFDVPIRLVREQRRGSAHARNRGMAEASGSVVVFIDDDVVPEPTWLSRLVEPIVAGRCDGAAGRVVLDPTVARPRWFVEGWMAGYLAAFHLADEEVALPADGWALTANIAFRAGLLRATGGFDLSLGPRSGVPLVNDDISLCRRFIAAGGRMRYVPEARVVHELPPARLQRRYIVRRLHTQGRSDWLLDREELNRLRFAGAGGTAQWLWRTMGDRRREGLHRAVAFRAVCDVAVATGRWREAARAVAQRRARRH